MLYTWIRILTIFLFFLIIPMPFLSAYAEQDTKNILQNSKEILKNVIPLPNNIKKESSLYYFVSFSMPISLLRTYLVDSACNGGILVLRGIDPHLTLSQFVVKKILPLLQFKGEHARLEINPKLFDQYEITLVPSFVFFDAEKNKYWKLSGSVSTLWALEEFHTQGADDTEYINRLLKNSYLNKYTLQEKI